MAPFTVAILYPNVPDATFDHEYYVKTHMSMVDRIFGKRMLGWRTLKIVGTETPTSGPPAYMVMTLIDFPDRATWDECYAMTGDELMPDIPKYTNQRPQFLVGEAFGGGVGSFGERL